MEASLVVPIIVALVTPIGAILIWLLNRKKHVADIYNALSESSQTAVETMQMTMQELRIELVEARLKIEELIAENALLRADLAALKEQNNSLIEQIHDMRVAYEQQSQQHGN